MGRSKTEMVDARRHMMNRQRIREEAYQRYVTVRTQGNLARWRVAADLYDAAERGYWKIRRWSRWG